MKQIIVAIFCLIGFLPVAAHGQDRVYPKVENFNIHGVTLGLPGKLAASILEDRGFKHIPNRPGYGTDTIRIDGLDVFKFDREMVFVRNDGMEEVTIDMTAPEHPVPGTVGKVTAIEYRVITREKLTDAWIAKSQSALVAEYGEPIYTSSGCAESDTLHGKASWVNEDHTYSLHVEHFLGFCAMKGMVLRLGETVTNYSDSVYALEDQLD